MLKEFREFTLKSNVIDLAVGIIIGAAFGAIVTSIVDNIFMPLVGMMTGGVDFKTLSVKVGSAELKYGMFIQATVTFLIIAFFLFLVVKAVNKIRLKTQIPLPISNTDKLLIQINEELIAIRTELKDNPGVNHSTDT
ncbi:MAG: large conductance mechanosensitive channel protein MscL [Chitinophagaceae bacterium]|nr:large conductance mechanosensitive channel protein MscL [Chitinophagaceae bacterium]